MKTNLNILIGIVIVLVFICLIAIVSYNHFNVRCYVVDNAVVSSHDKDVLKVGVVLPLSGNNVIYGQAVQEGLELAIKEINSDEQKIKLIYEDSASESKNAVSAAQKLINIDKVDALITILSHHSLAIAPIAEENKVPQFTMASQAKDLNFAGEYIFTNDDILESLGDKLAVEIYNMNYRKVGIIYANYNEAALDSTKSFEKKFKELGGEIVASESYSSGDEDYKTLLSKIKSGNPDAIFVNGLMNENGAIIKQIKELGMNQQMFGGGALESQQVIDVAGEFANGIFLATFQGFPSDKFVDLAEKEYNHYPLRFSAEAYDGLKILELAYDNIDGNVNRESFKQELDKIKVFKGEASGTVQFDELGNAQRDVSLKTIKDGKFVEFEQ